MKPSVASLAFCGLAWAATTICPPLPAQEDAAPARTITADSDVEVQLVELVVRVVDRKGRPVEGLSAGDFQMRVDDEVLPVEHFAAGRPASVGTRGSRADDAGSDRSAERGELPLMMGEGELGADYLDPGRERHLIVYLDQRFLDTAELASARKELLKFLRNDVPAGTRVMLATAADELRIVQGFTHEPALVADALRGLEMEQGGSVWRTQYDLVMQEIQRSYKLGSTISSQFATRSQGSSDDVRAGEYPLEATNDERLGHPLDQGENRGATELLESDPRYSLEMIDSFGRSVEAGLQASAVHMARLVSAASGLPGDKTVLYIGGTLPVNATKTLFELWQDTYSDLADGSDWVGMQARDRAWMGGVAAAAFESGARFSEALERLGRVADVASASGVTFHTLDVSVGGRLGRGVGDVENNRSDVQDLGGARSRDTNLSARSDSGVRLLADRTGGRSLANRNFERFFDGLAGDLATSYSLAFRLRPPEESPEAGLQLHDVEVELTREAEERLRKAGVRGVETHHRRKVTVRTLEQEQVERTVSALAMRLESVNPLEIEVLAGEPRTAEDGGLLVPLSVKVPMSKLALIPDRQAHAGRLSIYVAVGGLERGARLEKAVVPVRIANRDLLTAFGRTVDYRLEVSGPPAAERLAVTVRDDFRPALSTVTTRFGTWKDAPQPEATQPPPAAEESVDPTGDPAADAAEGRL